MTERAPKTPIDEALQRRISDAMSADDGLAGDPDLSPLLSSNKGASSYAKDLARINKWLVSWPVPEPTDDAFEALATRIEQRLGETLPGAASTFFGPPDFDDDDATRDATAGLLGAALPSAVLPSAALPSAVLPSAVLPSAVLAGAKKGTLVGMPMAGKANAVPPPRSPLSPLKPLAASKPDALVSKPLVSKPLAGKPVAALSPLAKKIAEAKAAENESDEVPAKAEPAKVEPTAPDLPKADAAEPTKPTADARTTDDLPVITSGELELVATPSIPPEAISIPPEAISIPPSAAAPSSTAAPPPRPPAPPSAKKKRKSKPPPAIALGEATDERFSIPMPAPIAPLPPFADLSSVRIARDKDEPKGGSWWPMLAAAAVVGLAVAGGMTFFGGGDSRVDEPMSATATLAPSEDSEGDEGNGMRGGLAESAPAAAPTTPSAPPTTVAPAPEVAPTTTASAAFDLAEAESAMLADDGLARDDYAPMRRAERSRVEAPRSAVGSGGGGVASASTGTPLGGTASSASSGTGRAARGIPSGAPSGGDASGSTGPSGGSAGSGGGSAGSGSSSSGTRAPAPTGPVPESPDRDAVRDALEGVRPQVQACFGDEHGLAEVVVIAVSSGRVTTATVSGRFAGTPVGSCIARAVRSARVPPFSSARFEVHYQYRY